MIVFLSLYDKFSLHHLRPDGKNHLQNPTAAGISPAAVIVSAFAVPA
jgi:hypothetical protein